MKKIKSKYIILILITVAIFIAALNLEFLRNSAKKFLPENIKNYVKILVFGEKYNNEIKFLKISNYNQKVFPETEFLKLDFEKRTLKYLNKAAENHYNILNKKKGELKKKFFVEIIEDQIFVFDAVGTSLLLNDEKNFEEKIIKNNIGELKTLDIKDVHFFNKEIFISYSYKKEENCNFFRIAKANYKNFPLKFKLFFSSDECLKNVIAGKMSTYVFEGTEGLLVTTGSDGREELKHAQIEDSFYGKIVFFDIDKKNYKLISKGHRNPQGLFIHKENIISTEHGPKGGDEINLIKKGGNFGWPISSYGESYKFKFNLNKNYKYKKNHINNNFVEPIFSFVPSIGISQIIKVPKNFSKFWNEDFLVSSLNGRSLFRIKFDKDYSKVVYIEKMIVGERIRDLVYSEKLKAFLLALEDTGSLGVVKVKEKF